MVRVMLSTPPEISKELIASIVFGIVTTFGVLLGIYKGAKCFACFGRTSEASDVPASERAPEQPTRQAASQVPATAPDGDSSSQYELSTLAQNTMSSGRRLSTSSSTTSSASDLLQQAAGLDTATASASNDSCQQASPTRAQDITLSSNRLSTSTSTMSSVSDSLNPGTTATVPATIV